MVSPSYPQDRGWNHFYRTGIFLHLGLLATITLRIPSTYSEQPPNQQLKLWTNKVHRLSVGRF